MSGAAQVLTPAALDFVAKLHRAFEPRRHELLARRAARQKEFDAGKFPDFIPETERVRAEEWTIGLQPEDLLDRRVEITGPTDRKMVINALNSGASTFMADFEDANCPTWANMVEGQINLHDAVRGNIGFEQEGKTYRLKSKVAVLIPRPRGWHLDEKHLLVDGKPVSGAIFDFALYFFHNAKELLARGTGPYFYLPKMESYLEARLWNDIFNFAQEELGVPQGSIKATAQLLERRLDRGGNPEALREGLARVDTIASRAAGLVDELLDLARMQMGQPLELERSPTNLVSLARDALAEQQHATERHTLELDTEESELVGQWDSRRMGRVLTNLVDNAVKYSPTGGRVVVRVRRERSEAVLEVQDSGIGIPIDDVARIFDRFQRGRNVERRVDGSGIGLASARHFVESHGGTIEVESEENVGSLFRIRLPLDMSS